MITLTVTGSDPEVEELLAYLDKKFGANIYQKHSVLRRTEKWLGASMSPGPCLKGGKMTETNLNYEKNP